MMMDVQETKTVQDCISFEHIFVRIPPGLTILKSVYISRLSPNIYTSISIASISFTGRMKFIPQ